MERIFCNFPIIKPHEKFKIGWDILILLITVFYFFIIPMQLSFDIFYDYQFIHFCKSINVPYILAKLLAKLPVAILFIDTILKFNTGYYEEGKIIMDRKKIIHHYIENSLIYDVLTYFPTLMQSAVIMMYEDISKLDYKTGIILKILEFLIFFKLKKLNSLLRNFENVMSLYGTPDHYLSILRLFVRIVFVAHCNGCLWHAIAYYRLPYNYTWLNYSSLVDADWVTKYWSSLYWAIAYMISVGYGEKVTPQGDLELFFGCLILLICSMNYGYSLNTIGTIIDLMSKEEENFK